jgi:hypothetical protein
VITPRVNHKNLSENLKMPIRNIVLTMVFEKYSEHEFEEPWISCLGIMHIVSFVSKALDPRARFGARIAGC